MVTKRSGPSDADEDVECPSPVEPPSENGIVLLGKSELEQSDRAFEDHRSRQSKVEVTENVNDGRFANEVSDLNATDAGPSGQAEPLAVSEANDDATNLMANTERAVAMTDSEVPETLAEASDLQTQNSSAELATDEVPEVEDDENDEVSALKTSLEWLTVLVGAVVVALLFRAFLFQAFWIPSESMEGTLEVDDRVMVNRLSYRLHDVHRGDVVVFKKPVGLESDVNDLIKRVMALEGETIEGRDNAVYVNGQRVAESYIDPNDLIKNFGPETVPVGHVFVMGDNRDDSTDSRVFGSIPIDTIVGRAFIIFWPFDRIEPL